MPSRRQHKENERDCWTIVQQLVSSIPQNVLTSTSHKRKKLGYDTQKRKVTFEDQDKESEKVEENPKQKKLSGRRKRRRTGEFKNNNRDTKVCPGSLN